MKRKFLIRSIPTEKAYENYVVNTYPFTPFILCKKISTDGLVEYSIETRNDDFHKIIPFELYSDLIDYLRNRVRPTLIGGGTTDYHYKVFDEDNITYDYVQTTYELVGKDGLHGYNFVSANFNNEEEVKNFLEREKNNIIEEIK